MVPVTSQHMLKIPLFTLDIFVHSLRPYFLFFRLWCSINGILFAKQNLEAREQRVWLEKYFDVCCTILECTCVARTKQVSHVSLYFCAPFLLCFSFLSYKSATNFILSTGSQHPSRFNLENLYLSAMLSLGPICLE